MDNERRDDLSQEDRYVITVTKQLNEIQNKLDSILLSSKGIVSSKDASKLLNISMGQLYLLTHKGEIPFYKPTGKLMYFSVAELMHWIKDKDLKRKMHNENGNVDKADRALLDWMSFNTKGKKK